MWTTGIIVRNTFVMYDREHEKIGFWKTNCSDIWERLHISGAPPQASPPSNGSGSTAEISPPSSPMSPPQYIAPGNVSSYLSVL